MPVFLEEFAKHFLQQYPTISLISLATPRVPTKCIFLSGRRAYTGACEGASCKDEISIALS
ncbi:hypothetical protein PROFUN_12828 [Planoprotostelium fungivorum]|uniref:Uncharacterized protein n=1 Tax=Planoprotostelium fungivorum TaxID=1890364 RepID=A0A2P6N6K7_9EUKA|nr:hypothetical protein PROFUN_12828 [Planoprotostelium fungivorum]